MNHRAVPALLALLALIGCDSQPTSAQGRAETRVLVDVTRDRRIPVAIYAPAVAGSCTTESRCPVVLLSAGHGMQNGQYTFLATALARLGFLVVGVQHEQPGDPPLAQSGNLYQLRMPVWRIGVANLQFVRATLRDSFPGYDWDRLALVGHSNGGDLSALLAHDDPQLVSALVTLDNRRYPLPRTAAPRVLSIRAGNDVAADAGVLPDSAEQQANAMRIVTIPEADHGELTDMGPPAVKDQVVTEVSAFLAPATPGP